MTNIVYIRENEPITENLSVFERKLFVYLHSDSPKSITEFVNRHNPKVISSISNLEKTGVFKSIIYRVEGGKATLKAVLKNSFVFLERHKDSKTGEIHIKQNTYIGINIDEYAKLRTKYAMRLYELFRQFKPEGKLFLKEETFRYYLSVSGDSYAPKCRLIERIIKPAIKRIEEVTNITVHLLKVENGRVIIRFKVKDSTKLINFKFKEKKKNNEKKPLKKITQIKEKVSAPQACSILADARHRKTCEDLSEKGVLSRVAVQALQRLGYNEVQSIYMAVDAKKTTIKYYAKYLERALKNATELKSASESQRKNIAYKQKESLNNHTIPRYHQMAPNVFIEAPKRDNLQAMGNLLNQSTLKKYARK